MTAISTFSAAKALGSAVVGGYQLIRRELAKIPSEDRERNSITDIEPHLQSAIDILAGASVPAKIRGLVSLPSSFKRANVRDWIRTEKAQVHLKQTAIRLIQGKDYTNDAAAAMAHYVAMATDDDPFAEIVFEEAMDYLQLSLRTQLSLGEQILLNASLEHGKRLESISEQMGRVADGLNHHAGTEHIDEALTYELLRIRRARFFISMDLAKEASTFASQVQHGSFSGASAKERARSLAWAARWLSRSNIDEAREKLSQSQNLYDCEEGLIAKAYITGFSDKHAAIALLDPTQSPMQASALLQIFRFGDTPPDEVLDFADTADLGEGTVDAEGKTSLISLKIEANRWNEALEFARKLSSEDYAEMPALLWLSAYVKVAHPLPPDLRPYLSRGVPPNPYDFPFPEHPAAVEGRRQAADHLEQLAEVAERIGLKLEARNAELFSLWLRLRDPQSYPAAYNVLLEKMRLPRDHIYFLPLALAFKLQVNREKALITLAKELAMTPGGNSDLASAQLALAMSWLHQDDRFAAQLLARTRREYPMHTDALQLLKLEFDILVRSGATDDARALLTDPDDIIDPISLEQMRSRLENGAEDIPIDELEARFAENGDTPTLAILVEYYEREGLSDRYIELARELISRSPQERPIRRLTGLLIQANRLGEALEILRHTHDLVETSGGLLGQHAWLLYQQGELTDAFAYLLKAEALLDHVNHRSLRTNLLIATGQWQELDAIVEKEWVGREDHSGDSLAYLAQLALRTKSKRLQDILVAAAKKAPDDPRILASLYYTAVSAGIEHELPETANWLGKAIQLSGDNGPMQSMSLAEIMALKPDWDSRSENVYQLFSAGLVPVSAAASALNRPWFDLSLVRMLDNLGSIEKRSRLPVGLFSGAHRPERPGAAEYTEIAIDTSSLLTLAFCDQLENAIGAWPKIRIAHATMHWLFEQRQKIAFHQPSRIAFAQVLSRLLERGHVKPFIPSTSADTGLIQDIGITLANLISTAAREQEGQHLVVHHFPIDRVGSLMTEVVDMSAYEENLCSCSGLVDSLVALGELAQDEAAKARRYLDVQDRRWPNEPKIHAGATLYLSDLSVDYCRSAGILEKIGKAGFHVIISDHEIEEAHALIDHEHRADQAASIIEKIRRSLSAAMQNDRIIVDAALFEESGNAPDDLGDPTMALAQLVTSSQAIICDDRFMNRYSNFDHEIGSTPILSTLDLLESLVDRNIIAVEEIWRCKTLLRRAGVVFVPIIAEEVSHYLAMTSSVKEREGAPAVTRETAELRAIRENIRLAQQRGWLQPSEELPWISKLGQELVISILQCWSPEVSENLARARSNWLLSLIDMRNWASSGQTKLSTDSIGEANVVLLTMLIVRGGRFKNEDASRFCRWLDEDVISRAEGERFPFYMAFITRLRENILSFYDPQVAADLPTKTELPGLDPVLQALDLLPRFLQVAVADDPQFLDMVPVTLDGQINIADGVARFTRSDFFRAVDAVYTNSQSITMLTTEDGDEWQLTTIPNETTWPLLLQKEDTKFKLEGIWARHPNREVRNHNFARELKETGINPAALATFQQQIQVGPLEDRLIEDLDREFGLAPIRVAETITETIRSGGASITQLIPKEELYFERLLGADEQGTFSTLVDAVSAEVSRLIAWNSELGSRQSLLFASHSQMLRGSALADLSDDAFLNLGRWVETAGDLMSATGYIELCLDRPEISSDLSGIIERLVRSIITLDPLAEETALQGMSALIVLVDGEMSQKGLLRHWSPFQRRCSSMAHAALIQRALGQNALSDDFIEWCYSVRGHNFIMQTAMDMRVEPRWSMDFVTPQQLRDEFLGRIINRAHENKDHLSKNKQLKALLFGNGKNSLKRSMNYPRAFYPGPLEGLDDKHLQVPPTEVSSILLEKLNKAHLQAADLYPLINLHFVCQIKTEILDKFVLRISQTGYRLIESESALSIRALLSGLAHLAACTRRPDLADQIALLLRQHRAYCAPTDRIEIGHELHVALIAAASHLAQNDWCSFLEPWLFGLAVRVEDATSAELLYSYLDQLCEIEPALSQAFGKTLATLQLYLET